MSNISFFKNIKQRVNNICCFYKTKSEYYLGVFFKQRVNKSVFFIKQRVNKKEKSQSPPHEVKIPRVKSNPPSAP